VKRRQNLPQLAPLCKNEPPEVGLAPDRATAPRPSLEETILIQMFPSRRLVLAAALLGSVAAGTVAAAGPQDLQSTVYEAKRSVLPALVHIQPILEVYRAGEREKMAVTGSGVILSEDGYVLTNNHVVERAERVTCTLHDQQVVEAELVGRDAFTDLAVIRLDLEEVNGPLQPARLGSSADLEAGQFVMALGSPLGLSRSISLGVISTVERYFQENQSPDGTITGTFNTWIQTDAAINPGNSGGPMVNLHGEVIGINARAIPVFGENLGFAIPIDLAKEVATKLIEDGKVERSWIGVTWQHLEAAPGLVHAPDGQGALVGSVVAGSPASEVGLQPGDVVVALDGRPVVAKHEEELPSLRKWIADLPVGREVAVEFYREEEVQRGTLVTQPLEDPQGTELEIKVWGFTVRSITEEVARLFRLEGRSGVLVTGVKPDSFAFEAGLRRGDIIRRMEEQEVPSLRVFEQRVNRLVEVQKAPILVEMTRGNRINFALLDPVYSRREPGAGGRR
jgi:serine protease Do